MNKIATRMGGGMTQDCDAGQHAFSTMLSSCEPIIRKVSRIYCWDGELRLDLSQEIRLELWRAWPRYDPARPAGAWAYRVALNVAIDYVRSSTRRRPTVELETDIADTTRLDEQIDDALVLERIVKASDPFDRAILLLFLEGHDQADIASIVGTTVSNVSTRLHRLKSRMTAHYQEGRQ